MPSLTRVTVPALLAGCAACGDADRPEMTEFSIDEASFSVPSEMIRSARDGREGFVRINDTESAIEVVYDPQLQQKSDARGYPVLFSVNDGDYPDLVYRRTAEGAPVVCRITAAAPSRKCGSPLRFKGSIWAVLFPGPRVAEAEAFRRRAEAVLERFST